MGKYIIAIGGTGIKCLESFLHISAFGGFGSEKDIYNVMVVEGDRGNGNKMRLQSAIANYINCQRVFYPKGVNTQEGLSRKENRDIEKRLKHGVFRDRYNVDTSKGKDAFFVWEPDNDKVSLAEMAGEADSSTNGLMEVLFSESEMNRKLHVGFEGHPNVGSLTMDYLMDFDDSASPWYNFLGNGNSTIMDGAETDIIIMGSVFGGTGAAGLYAVANKIKTYKHTADGGVVTADYARLIDEGKMRIGIVMMLPYFLLPTPDKNEESVAPNMMENTAYALDYYIKKQNFLQDVSLVLVGKSNREPIVEDKDRQTGKHAKGDEEQRNKSMTPEMIAAFAAKDFLNKRIGKGQVTYALRKKDANLESQDSLVVDWGAIPAPIDYQKKLTNMLLFSLIYITKIHPILQTKTTDTAKYQWLGKCVNDLDNVFYTKADNLRDYLKSFVEWALDVSTAGDKSNDTYKLINYVDISTLLQQVPKNYTDAAVLRNYELNTEYNDLVVGIVKRTTWNQILEKLIKRIVIHPASEEHLGLHRLFTDLFDCVI